RRRRHVRGDVLSPEQIRSGNARWNHCGGQGRAITAAASGEGRKRRNQNARHLYLARAPEDYQSRSEGARQEQILRRRAAWGRGSAAAIERLVAGQRSVVQQAQFSGRSADGVELWDVPFDCG